MAVEVTFLYSRPQHEIASLIRDNLARCRFAKIVSGFVTPDGVKALQASPAAGRIRRFVVGGASVKGFDALDDLIDAGLSPQSVRVHLGRSRHTRKNSFARLRPMLHSKIYLFEMPNGTAVAIVGSHNMTKFGLRGLNGEAGILLAGPSSASVFVEIREHIEESFRQAVWYDRSLKRDYALWLKDYAQTDPAGVQRDYETKATVLLLERVPEDTGPSVGESIYFELDQKLSEISTIGTGVHLFLFDPMPHTPSEALAGSAGCSVAWVGAVEAIDSGAGSVEVEADWYIDRSDVPELTRSRRRLRPELVPGKQQVRARINGTLGTHFQYFVERPADRRVDPILGSDILHDNEEQVAWSLVTGLQESEAKDEPRRDRLQARLIDVEEVSPGSGSFVRVSQWRREISSRPVKTTPPLT